MSASRRLTPCTWGQAGILRSALFGAAATLLLANSAPALAADAARLAELGRRIYVDGILPDGAQLTATRFEGASVVVIGHEKGADTEGRLKRNFGMARPEGYRKAQRLMRLADRFGLPVITLIDTPGAYPGVDAEARGQAEAIARSIETCVALTVPLVSVIIGEGGSGGAMALAVANTVLMQEHAIYSVISPEGCASILWRDGDKAEEAAEALKLTAKHLFELGIIDKIIAEPLGGAHRDKRAAIATVGDAVAAALSGLSGLDGDTLKARRREKFLAMGGKGLS